METKSTDRDILVKGLKKMGISIAFMFLGPTVLYIAFSNQEKILYIPLIVIGVLFCISAIYFAFKGLNTILDSMFKSNKTR
ncbi:DUF6095 family protein [Lacinutrix sp. MedPE-SW]|uniref:DUF6095 family protein n=1 Tax=Lacinutrix sp. MedPE-SW TaxID=1860087 RepID=UPI00091DFBF2|nr:DUF6095 family protein [Lacinutrix sp. MedPE-SW]OIQ16300.1 MAG: hypothetical protein BM549_13365 [Lacinutrix sp. MedPE-SW]